MKHIVSYHLSLALLALSCVTSAQMKSSSAPTETVKQPKTSRYIPGYNLDLRALLSSPPKNGSDAATADLAAVHLAEAQRTTAQVRDAQRDDHDETMFAFASVLGSRFREADLPLTAALSLHLRAESGVVNPSLKIAFQRKRPFVADVTLHPVCDRADTNSYPSGHAMVGYLEGFALAQMIPEESDAILQRARQFAGNRIVCGVHYPTDIEASRTVALALFGAISTSPLFQRELAAARGELREKLPITNPDRAARSKLPAVEQSAEASATHP